MTAMFTRLIASLLLAIGLTACVPVTADGPGVGPGDTPVSAVEAAAYFSNVCVANRGALRNGLTILSGPDFAFNTRNEIYFHQRLNLSFKLIPRGQSTDCSMVWGSNDSYAANEGAVRATWNAVQMQPTAPLLNARLSGQF